MHDHLKRVVLLLFALSPISLSGCVTDCVRWENRLETRNVCNASGINCRLETTSVPFCAQRSSSSSGTGSSGSNSKYQEESRKANERFEQWKRDYPLHSAVSNGDLEKVKQLIAAGADLNEQDPTSKIAGIKIGNNTPLHYAAQYGRPEITRLLISHGVKLNVKNARDQTPLDGARTGRESGHYSSTKPAERQRLKDYDEVIEVLKASGAKDWFSSFEK